MLTKNRTLLSQCFSKEIDPDTTKIPKPTSFCMVALCSAPSFKPFKHCSRHSTLSMDQVENRVPRNSLQYFQVCFQAEIYQVVGTTGNNRASSIETW